MEKMVSIIVPVYNVSRYLPACLESLLHQTYSCLEIILVDDGSTDESGCICDTYASNDERIQVIHQANAGAANAKNAGLDAAKGDFITFLDSDDWVEPNWIEKAVAAAVDGNADVVEYSFWMDYTDCSKPGNNPDTFVKTDFETEAYMRQYPALWSCALFWNKLFRASLLEDVRFHRERRCIDDEFFTYKAVTGANRVLRIPDMLYHYRQRRSSVTQSEKTRYQRTIDDIDILAERHQWMKTHYPTLALDYLRHDVDTLLYFAGTYPFNQEAILCFRKASKYYFTECLHRYPGKITFFYAIKALLYRKDQFLTALPVVQQIDTERLFL